MPPSLPLTDEFLVNTRTASSQLSPEITTLASGRYVIAWVDFGGGIDVHAQVYAADGTRIGPEITVNTTEDRTQDAPKIVALAGGGFVIVFDDESTQPDGRNGPLAGTVRAQVFDDDGAKLGTEIIVNTANIRVQSGGIPVALADGGFAITWEDRGSLGVGGAIGDTDGWAIKMQAFNANGTPRGAEILVNTTTAGTQSDPQGTALANGNFVITWTDGANVYRRPGSAGRDDVRAQIFDATGAKVGAEILVNTATFSDQRFQKIVALEGGGFVITWEDYSRSSTASPGSEIVAQVFAANGARIGSEVTVNTQRQDEQEEPEIAALAGGGFVIAWIDDSPERYESGAAIPVRIKAQVLAADGTPVGSEIMVSLPEPGPNSQRSHKIAALGDGGFVIVWKTGSGNDDDDIHARTFNADGTPSSDEILVNQATEDSQINPEVTAVGTSGFVVTWEDDSGGVGGAGGDTDRWAIKARQFGPDPNAPVNSTGTDGPDLLVGAGGADVLRGMGGNDTLHGMDGADTLEGGAGDDFLYGGSGEADLRDVIYGGDGNDSIDGGWGNDELHGGEGNDTVLGDFGSDTLIGNAGNDLISGGAGSDLMFGGPGNDTLNGGWGYDRLNGGAGADRFFHAGVADHASDWIQDYNAAEGDLLVFGLAGATRAQFQVNTNFTPGAGSAAVEEAFIIYRPTGQIMWALVDGDAQDSINIQLSNGVFDLLA